MSTHDVFSNQEFLDRPYAEHVRALWLTSLQLRSEPSPDPFPLAFTHALFFVAAQLDEVEKQFAAGGRSRLEIARYVRTPWVMGYLFGMCAAVIDGQGLERASPTSTGLILSLHQLALREPDEAAIEPLSAAAHQDPAFGAGMAQAGADYDAIALTGDFGKHLRDHLLAQSAAV